MVYSLADWGMGDSELQQYAGNDLHLDSAGKSEAGSQDSEVALLPLTNQVSTCFLFFLRKSDCYVNSMTDNNNAAASRRSWKDIKMLLVSGGLYYKNSMELLQV